MAEAMQNEAILEPVEQEIKPKQPWKRQNGEPTLWYNRFNRYCDLGYKRSLEAAWKQEQQTIKALKSTKDEEKIKQPRRKGVGSAVLAEVPKPKLPQVPGSWKKASTQWNWVARAQAWDEHVIDLTVEANIGDVIDGVAMGINRVRALKSMLGSLQNIYNLNYKTMSLDEVQACMARMQSLIKDIREEMKDYDESVTRVLMRKHCQELYQQMDSNTLDEVRKEQARRKQAGKVL